MEGDLLLCPTAALFSSLPSSATPAAAVPEERAPTSHQGAEGMDSTAQGERGRVAVAGRDLKWKPK